MRMISFTFVNHSVVISRTDNKVLVDSKEISLKGEHLTLAECIVVNTLKYGVSISTPAHDIEVYYHKDHTEHINTTYLDFKFDLKTTDIDPVNYGGIVGGTVKDDHIPENNEAAWSTSSLLSTDAKSNTYAQIPMKCKDKHGNTLTSKGHKRTEPMTASVAHV